MINIIAIFLAAIGGIIFASIVIEGENRRYEQKVRKRQERKKLGKKWYDD